MGQSRAERTWRRPRLTRHAWVRLPVANRDHPLQPPAQALVISWKKVGWQWLAMVVIVVETDTGDPVIVQQWVPAESVRPVPADPNRAFGNR